MARSCGLRIGPRRFELVVLEGNAKKHRITAFQASEFPRGGEDERGEAAAALREAAKSHSIPHDNIALVIDTGLAAFRTVKLPFEDRDKLAQVIKFEVEGQLPQWNIDDVVIDFVVLDSKPGETTALVTAVPKKDVRAALELCQRAGLEPHEIEVEATAMVNAAFAAEVCPPGEAQILMHIGEASTSLVVVDGGRLSEVRAVHIGALSHLSSGEAAAQGVPAKEGEAPAPPPGPEEVRERMDQIVSRLRRELVRGLTAARTVNAITAIHVCGLELPGLVGSHVSDVPVYVLDVFEEDSGQPAEGTAPLVVAYGAALRQLGPTKLAPSLRREELRFTGTFERMELPVAVAGLLLVTWLAVFTIFEWKHLFLRERDVKLWLGSTVNFMLGDMAAGRPGNLQLPSVEMKKYLGEVVDGRDTQRTYDEQLQEVEWRLQREIEKIEKELGKNREITKPQSALHGLTLVLGVMNDEQDQIGRVSLRKIDSQYQRGTGGNPDQVRVVLDATFFAEDSAQATQNFDTLKRAWQQEGNVWCKAVNDRGSRSLDNGKGIYVQGLEILVDLSKVLAAASRAES